MAYKYKLNEMSKTASPEAAEKETGIPKDDQRVGKVTYSKDGDTKFTVTNINPETGQISWKITNLPAFDKLLDDADALISTSKGVYTKTKDDEKFREFYEEARSIRNKIRKHLRNEYPDEYKRIQMFGEGHHEEVEEISTSGAAGAYNTPYAFVRKPLKPKGKKKKKSKYKMKMPSGMVSSLGYTMAEGKLVKKDKEDINEEKAITFKPGTLDDIELSTRILDKFGIKYKINNYDLILSNDDYLVVLDYLKGGNNVNVNLSNSILNENNNNPGAILGPGPKAGPDGVTDSAYTKQFKYKLVPKTKDGTYVQKGSGMVVKKLF